MRSESQSGMCTKLPTVAASNNRDHTPQSLYYCLFVPRIYTSSVFFRAHSVCGEPRIPVQRQWSGCNNISSFFQQTAPIVHSLCECWTKHDLHILGRRTILMWSESPSGMCAKLHTVAASNNRDHMLRSLCYCLFAPRIYSAFLRAHSVRGEPRIPAQCQRSGCNKSKMLSQLTFNTFLGWVSPVGYSWPRRLWPTATTFISRHWCHFDVLFNWQPRFSGKHPRKVDSWGKICQQLYCNRPGVVNQPETKSHIYCVTAKSRIIHMD